MVSPGLAYGWNSVSVETEFATRNIFHELAFFASLQNIRHKVKYHLMIDLSKFTNLFPQRIKTANLWFSYVDPWIFMSKSGPNERIFDFRFFHAFFVPFFALSHIKDMDFHYYRVNQ